ncbi:epoxide hydrolase family protein [Luteimonas salinilitoris]|uniref:Epoxide hydrolase family protein n=1 Tax=Luteimonas salinilitoris TaxID=3237697 RepID=A0ABV4HV99_9GAMM
MQPFRIAVPQHAIEDLYRRLDRARLPGSVDEGSWEDGASLSFIKRLVHHWRYTFDWRTAEARLNELPQFMAKIGQLDVHFVYQKGVGPAPLPLVLTHGWPGSFIEMERILPLLTDPGSHGGDPGDAFDVVVPSLPGFGFSQAPTEAGVSSRQVAQMWKELMLRLGYSRFGAQGGDIGAGVSTWLAKLYPEHLVGIQLNYIPGSFRPALGQGQAPVRGEEEAFLERAAAWVADEGAYAAQQGTKPLTLAYSLADSPIGLAAWIVEKFQTWSDCAGDIENTFTMDELLTDISLYWFGGQVEASLRIYKENRAQPLVFTPGERVVPPMGMALFPKELPLPPRAWVERVFDVRRWTPMPRGGHFAAWEQPALLAEEMRAFFRPLR